MISPFGKQAEEIAKDMNYKDEWTLEEATRMQHKHSLVLDVMRFRLKRNMKEITGSLAVVLAISMGVFLIWR